jgi:hypothetical protein
MGWRRRNVIPAALPDTGAYNGHLVRDLGLVYVIAGLGFGWSALNLSKCRDVHIGLTIFFFGHALMHVVDILLGRLPVSHWLIDIPLVFGPGLIMLLLSVPKVWNSVNPEYSFHKPS